MKFRLERRRGDDVRVLWLIAVLIVGFGSYFIETRFERAIGIAHDNTESLYRRMVANERIVQEAGALRQLETTAMSDLRRVSHETSLSVTTAALVAALDRSAQTYHTSVTGLEPGIGKLTPGSPPSIRDERLIATDLTIKVCGRFRDLLRFVEDLSHHRTLISVSDTQLAIASGESERHEPKLDATIHATLYRLRLPESTQEARFATAR
jgi:hypothetical protein